MLQVVGSDPIGFNILQPLFLQGVSLSSLVSNRIYCLNTVYYTEQDESPPCPACSFGLLRDVVTSLNELVVRVAT